MNEIIKLLLDKHKALLYLRDNLEGTNTLSTAVCQHLDFDKGNFYALVPEDLPEKQIYEFKQGGIRGQGRIPIIDVLLEKFLHEQSLICLFDDGIDTYTPSYDWPLFSEFGVHYSNEIYYLLTNKEFSQENLNECFKTSNVTWHSLCVVSKLKHSRKEEKSISKKDLITIAKAAEMICLLAYDAESYIFWEKDI